MVIIDGRVQKKNLEIIGKDEAWLKKKLEEEGLEDIKDVIYAYATDKKEEVTFDIRR